MRTYDITLTHTVVMTGVVSIKASSDADADATAERLAREYDRRERQISEVEWELDNDEVEVTSVDCVEDGEDEEYDEEEDETD